MSTSTVMAGFASLRRHKINPADHDLAEGAAFRMTNLGNRIRKLQRTSGSGVAQIKAA